MVWGISLTVLRSCSPSPVSYTHLDVYKRQDEPEPISAISSRSLLKQSYDPENLLDQALTILSDLTDSVAFAILPARTEDVIEKIRFLPLSSHCLLYTSRCV